MKKIIAMILVLVLITALVACGGKSNEITNVAAGGNETIAQTDGTSAATESATEATVGDAAATTEATATSTPDEEEVPATQPKDNTNNDDVKVPVDGDTDVPVETPDSNNVISFDELLEVA